MTQLSPVSRSRLPTRLALPKISAGQAMTEFVVSVAFVFLAIFVFVPTFGKIMDLQFQNQMASRYVAWERTVWFDQISDDNRDDFVISGDEFESVATRDDDDVMNTAENRFFYKHGGLLPAFIDDDDTAVPNAETSGIWTYVQSKNSMYGDTTLVGDTYDAEPTPTLAYDVVDSIGDGIQAIKSPLDFLLDGAFDEDFLELPLMTDEKTFYNPTVRTQINIGNAHGKGDSVWDRDDSTGDFTPGIESAFFQVWDGALESRSAILADGWNTQSLEHYKERADDYVPSTLFDNALFDVVIDIASILEGGPSNSAIGKLSFGEIGVEPMPAKEGKPLDVECRGGECQFESEW